jgi:glucosamine--fructose-6-phosphate aminotransferase (isomerizing)
MCGIFGYIGNKENASQIIFEGLKTLEYRGYDSWGIVVENKDGKLKVEKDIGKLPDKIPNSHLSSLTSHIGIGHTRWATHGGVTVANAHPHLDCTGKIAVIHNGIVENFQEIKDELIEAGLPAGRQGHKFISETDTEVIPHLIEEELSRGGGTTSFSEAVRSAFNRLKGLNAIVAMNSESSEIAAAKTGSPLVIGINDDEFFIASDAAGIVKHTKKVIFLEDNQMVVLKNPKETLPMMIHSLPDGNKITPKIQTLDWTFETADKGSFKHFLIKEIYDQPVSIADAVTQNKKDLYDFAKLIEDSFGTYLVGCGTAAHACRMATYIFSIIAKKHVNFCVGSEFSYFEDFLTDKSLLVVASQSGETADLLDAVSAARRHGSKITALINVIGSTIYRESDLVLPLRAGLEKSVLSTKAFTSKLAIFYLLAFILAGKYEEGKEMILQAASATKKLLDNEKFINNVKSIAKEVSKFDNIYILGRGLSFPIALEAAHKIKEASYIHAEGFAGGEPKHCEISLVSRGTPTIVFVPNDETKDAIISNAMEFKARGAHIIGISPEKHQVFDEWIEVPDLGIVSSIINVIPAQLLAYYLALAKGIEDPDKPRNLAKSVTVK